MEKFAVDLDAVLDEFEFHEEQAESRAILPPSRSGFFSSAEEETDSILSSAGEELSTNRINGVHSSLVAEHRCDLSSADHAFIAKPAKDESPAALASNGTLFTERNGEPSVDSLVPASCYDRSAAFPLIEPPTSSFAQTITSVSSPTLQLRSYDHTTAELPGAGLSLSCYDHTTAELPGAGLSLSCYDQTKVALPAGDPSVSNFTHAATAVAAATPEVAAATPNGTVEQLDTLSRLNNSLPVLAEVNTSVVVNSSVIEESPGSDMRDIEAWLMQTDGQLVIPSDVQSSSSEALGEPSDSQPSGGPAPVGDLSCQQEVGQVILKANLNNAFDTQADLLRDLISREEGAEPVPASNQLVCDTGGGPDMEPGIGSGLVGDDDYVEEGQLMAYLRQLELERDEEQKLLEAAPSEEEAGQTGARPKQPQFLSVLPPSLEDLEPMICPETAASSTDLQQDVFLLDADDLSPTIIPGASLPESPPPYSEVDPMEGQPGATARPPRPASLDLHKASPAAVGSGGPEETGDTSDDASVAAGTPVLGAPGETPCNPTGPRLGAVNLLAGLSEEQLMLGRIQPYWVPDSDALNCMICAVKFTVMKRRHHCRACGKVLCSACCSEKFRLHYMEGREGRVCTPCLTVLERLDRAEQEPDTAAAASASSVVQQQPPSRPNPANPMEYCSRIPVAEQVAAGASSGAAQPPPSVLVPVGVLKRNSTADASGLGLIASGSSSTPTKSAENKSVIFSDGIRPGGELTELDGSHEHRPLGRRPVKVKSRRVTVRGGRGAAVGGDVCSSKLPAEGLPLVSGKGRVEDEEIQIWLSAGTIVSFVLNNNLTVLTKRVNYSPMGKLVWNFASRGLTSVGQDEIVILLEVEEEEALPPSDIFHLIQTIYEQAGGGQPIQEMGHIAVKSDHLGSSVHGGWLFVRHTFQTVADLFLPPPPVLFGLLCLRPEMPWARVFPLRLMLRLGAEYRYYPAPLVSTRGRSPVYGEIGHTIMNVLADFKNYAYALPIIRGLVIHMSPGRTSILIPKNRHAAVSKALSNSNDPVLALGANFSLSADSHLVAMQTTEGSYQTQAINILNKERKVTGASFVVFNGALKSTTNLTAKSSIVEDGIMVQVLPDDMAALRKSLLNMENRDIGCGPVGAENPDELISIQWVDEDKAFNIGIKSAIDGKAMDGVGSLRIHSGPDLLHQNLLIRWTEVFLIKTENGLRVREGGVDPTRVAEGVARAVGVALLPALPKLKEDGLTPLAVRISLDQDNVSYEAGADCKPLPPEYMNSLDNELVPLLHSVQPVQLVLELVFHILDR